MLNKIKIFWSQIQFIWRNGSTKDISELLNIPLGIILYFTGFGIIIYHYGWWLPLGLFLIFWSRNIDNGFKYNPRKFKF